MVFFLSLITACGGTPEQKKYREEIGKMGVDFDAYEFFNRIDKRDMNTVKLFLKAGYDVNDRFPKRRGVSKSEMTPLMYTISKGMPDMAKLFIERGRT